MNGFRLLTIRGSMVRLIVFAALAVSSSSGESTESPSKPEDYTFYVYLKTREIIKMAKLTKNDDGSGYSGILPNGDAVKFPIDKVLFVKAEKKPVSEDDKPPEEITKTILDLSSDPVPYLDKPITIEKATLTLSTYFNYGYRDERSDYVSFEIRDRTGSGYVYVRKSWEGAEVLRQRALKNGSVPGKFTIVLVGERYKSSASAIMAELTGYSISKE